MKYQLLQLPFEVSESTALYKRSLVLHAKTEIKLRKFWILNTFAFAFPCIKIPQHDIQLSQLLYSHLKDKVQFLAPTVAFTTNQQTTAGIKWTSMKPVSKLHPVPLFIVIPPNWIQNLLSVGSLWNKTSTEDLLLCHSPKDFPAAVCLS